MRGADRLLLLITAFSILLVITSFVLILAREKPQYWSEWTPQATAHDYLLAFTQNDLARAYSYLSPKLDGHPPSQEAFVTQLSKRRRGDHISSTLTLKLVGWGEQENARVRVWERRFRGDPLELIFGFQKGTFEGIYVDGAHMPDDVYQKLFGDEWGALSTYEPTKFIPTGHFIRSFDIELQWENGDWKIIGAQTYWMFCWEMADGCE